MQMQEYIQTRFKQLVKDKVDPEVAYTQAAAEYIKNYKATSVTKQPKAKKK